MAVSLFFGDNNENRIKTGGEQTGRQTDTVTTYTHTYTHVPIEVSERSGGGSGDFKIQVMFYRLYVTLALLSGFHNERLAGWLAGWLWH